ncbi:hypothetical protein DBV05_g9961 [Lasiodiplodia theobromae]|uniref:Uncharacterized protein n=1 Tax=Lasiodiplodia theobromae TaxID=45133 RepID=A0A5N5D117_9PEZI|nr:hypothetical protein DBV05_g9961 [Lasiodiplodia theobromae]
MATPPALRAIATTIGAAASLNHIHTEFLFLSAMDFHERARLQRHQAIPVTVTEERQLPRQHVEAYLWADFGPAAGSSVQAACWRGPHSGKSSNCSTRVHLQAYSTQHLAGIPDLFPMLLPEAVWKPVFGQALDQLLVAAFRLLAGGDLTAASPKRVGKTVVEEVKRRLNAQLAKSWAKLCIDPGSYGEAEIMRAVTGALPAVYVKSYYSI